jgi:curved DNA-binding protein CbpA
VSNAASATRPLPNHYRLLGLHPSAGDQQIRRAYRDRSRLYHPDTTKLPPLLATQKFQRLNEAYGILSSPERRRLYDLSIGYSRWSVVQSQSPIAPNPAAMRRTQANSATSPASVTEQYERTASAYLDATDRPLSPGELFALFILGLTFVGCLMIAIFVGLSQPQSVIQSEFARELGFTRSLPHNAPNAVQPPQAAKEPVTLDRPPSSPSFYGTIAPH